jgi:hypothetical protein
MTGTAFMVVCIKTVRSITSTFAKVLDIYRLFDLVHTKPAKRTKLCIQ